MTNYCAECKSIVGYKMLLAFLNIVAPDFRVLLNAVMLYALPFFERFTRAQHVYDTLIKFLTFFTSINTSSSSIRYFFLNFHHDMRLTLHMRMLFSTYG